MSPNLQDIEEPAPAPTCTPEEILLGPFVDPFDRIKLYSDVQFEQMIEEWAFFYLRSLQREYKRVRRLGGSGDKGRDVIGYVDPDSNPIVIDVFQCKHYGHPLRPSEFWPELAKLCLFTHQGTIPLPRKYYITAPQNCGPDLTSLLDNPVLLKDRFIKEWRDTKKPNPLCRAIDGGMHELVDELAAYVDAFDFTRINCKPIIEVVEELRNVPHRYAPRFGGGLIKPLPIDMVPPDQIAVSEAPYVECLLAAYRQHKSNASLTCEGLADYLRDHFKMSRERYYCAETIKEFSREVLPEPFTFAQVQGQVYDNIFDTVNRPDYVDGYFRVIESVRAAQATQILNHPLKSYLKVRSLQGICHQLANEGKVKWTI